MPMARAEKTMTVLYATQILPLFRPQDIACMARPGVLLDSVTYMSDATGDAHYADHANARHIYARLAGTETPQMPPDVAGRWSAANLALYQQWMTDGFH
jgi:hypothetical protein